MFSRIGFVHKTTAIHPEKSSSVPPNMFTTCTSCVYLKGTKAGTASIQTFTPFDYTSMADGKRRTYEFLITFCIDTTHNIPIYCIVIRAQHTCPIHRTCMYVHAQHARPIILNLTKNGAKGLKQYACSNTHSTLIQYAHHVCSCRAFPNMHSMHVQSAQHALSLSRMVPIILDAYLYCSVEAPKINLGTRDKTSPHVQTSPWILQ